MAKENIRLLVITDQDESQVMKMILKNTPYSDQYTELNLAPYRRAQKEDIIAQHLMTHEYDAVLVPALLHATAAVRAQHLGPVIGYSSIVTDRESYDAVINLIHIDYLKPERAVMDSLEGLL